jgi:hypothetical protein
MLQMPLGEHLIIAERVRVAPAWRCLGGAGRHLASRLFRQICCDPAIVAAQPFPLDITRDDHGNTD